MLVRTNRKVNKCIQVLNMFATPRLIVPGAKPRLRNWRCTSGCNPPVSYNLEKFKAKQHTLIVAQFLLVLFQTSSNCAILVLPSRSNWCQLQFKVHLVPVFLELVFGER